MAMGLCFAHEPINNQPLIQNDQLTSSPSQDVGTKVVYKKIKGNVDQVMIQRDEDKYLIVPIIFSICNPISIPFNILKYLKGNYAQKAWFPMNQKEANESKYKTVATWRQLGFFSGACLGSIITIISLVSLLPEKIAIGMATGIGTTLGLGLIGHIFGHVDHLLYRLIGKPIMKLLTSYEHPTIVEDHVEKKTIKIKK